MMHSHPSQKVKRPSLWDGLLIVAVLLLVAAPLFLRRGAKFAGADDSVQHTIAELRPGFQPWIKPLWEPPSGEIASLLFSLQAAAGAGFIGYYFGLRRGRKETMDAHPDTEKHRGIKRNASN